MTKYCLLKSEDSATQLPLAKYHILLGLVNSISRALVKENGDSTGDMDEHHNPWRMKRFKVARDGNSLQCLICR